MPWAWPLEGRQPLLPDTSGRFGTVRSTDVHTGVDLYCEIGTRVVAVESGVVLDVLWFTGRHVLLPDGTPTTWWNDTQAILVQGSSGIVVYGEVSARVTPNMSIVAGQNIGVVDTAVLRSFKGRPMVMLHIELYAAPSANIPVWWMRGEPKPDGLLDPTPHLGGGHAHFDLDGYDGRRFRPR